MDTATGSDTATNTGSDIDMDTATDSDAATNTGSHMHINTAADSDLERRLPLCLEGSWPSCCRS